jgi:hypothetical protein
MITHISVFTEARSALMINWNTYSKEVNSSKHSKFKIVYETICDNLNFNTGSSFKDLGLYLLFPQSVRFQPQILSVDQFMELREGRKGNML